MISTEKAPITIREMHIRDLRNLKTGNGERGYSRRPCRRRAFTKKGGESGQHDSDTASGNSDESRFFTHSGRELQDPVVAARRCGYDDITATTTIPAMVRILNVAPSLRSSVQAGNRPRSARRGNHHTIGDASHPNSDSTDRNNISGNEHRQRIGNAAFSRLMYRHARHRGVFRWRPRRNHKTSINGNRFQSTPALRVRIISPARHFRQHAHKLRQRY